MSDEAYREVVASDGETHIGVTRGTKLYSVAFRRIWPEGRESKPAFSLSLTPDERRALIDALQDRED